MQATRRARVLVGEGPVELRHGAQPLLDHAVDGVDGLLARDLAGGVAAHPVGDDVEPERSHR